MVHVGIPGMQGHPEACSVCQTLQPGQVNATQKQSGHHPCMRLAECCVPCMDRTYPEMLSVSCNAQDGGP